TKSESAFGSLRGQNIPEEPLGDATPTQPQDADGLLRWARVTFAIAGVGRPRVSSARRAVRGLRRGHYDGGWRAESRAVELQDREPPLPRRRRLVADDGRGVLCTRNDHAQRPWAASQQGGHPVGDSDDELPPGGLVDRGEQRAAVVREGRERGARLDPRGEDG